MVYGAIIGDVVGSRFEFDRPGWTKDFKLFTEECDFTDDTIMTLAVGRALELAGKDADEKTIKTNCIVAMKYMGQLFPNAGYGANFINWLWEDNPKPYGSCGNGSAMRVSPVGWLYDDLSRTRQVARWTAEISHNHPEGIKGAECTAAVIWLARHDKTKEEIEKYVIEEFGYDVSTLPEEYRENHHHDETCQDTMPKALVAFLEGKDFEDVIREAVSFGGDADTIAAIAGSMAEAMYEIPKSMIKKATDKLTGYLRELAVKVEKEEVK